MENFDPNKTPKKQILSAQIDLSKFERATDEEKRQQDVMSESTSFFKDGMRKLFKNPLAVLSIVVLAAIILTIIVAPMIVPYGYEEILSVNGKRDKGAKNLAPFTYSKAEQKYIDEGGTRFPHIMGTDEQCRALDANSDPIPGLYVAGVENGSLFCSPYYAVGGSCSVTLYQPSRRPVS